MDNVEDPGLLNNSQSLFANPVEDLTPFTLGSNILFTTRKNFDITGVSSYDVGTLSPESSYALLSLRKNKSSCRRRNTRRH
jgi:hypothetical protein